MEVLVQPVFVIVDGETLTRVPHATVTIPSAEWPTYSSERFRPKFRHGKNRLDAEALAELGDGT